MSVVCICEMCAGMWCVFVWCVGVCGLVGVFFLCGVWCNRVSLCVCALFSFVCVCVLMWCSWCF